MATICEIPAAHDTVAGQTHTAALAPLRAEWNALARGVPFRAFDWLENWWKTYGGQGRKQLLVLTVRDQYGALVGLAPWYLERGPGGTREIQFLGSGEVCSDYLTILARPGCEDRVAKALAGWLCPSEIVDTEERTSWDVLRLGSVNEQDATLRPFVAQLANRGLLVYQRSRSSCWRVHLPESACSGRHARD